MPPAPPGGQMPAHPASVAPPFRRACLAKDIPRPTYIAADLSKVRVGNPSTPNRAGHAPQQMCRPRALRLAHRRPAPHTPPPPPALLRPTQVTLSQALAGSGFDPALRTFFSCEGLIYYLPEASSQQNQSAAPAACPCSACAQAGAGAGCCTAALEQGCRVVPPRLPMALLRSRPTTSRPRRTACRPARLHAGTKLQVCCSPAALPRRPPSSP